MSELVMERMYAKYDNSDVQLIRNWLFRRDLLLQLDEELAEMIAAGCKLLRIMRGMNPTPVTEEEARRNLQEEISDVVNMSIVLEIGLLMTEFDGMGDQRAVECMINRAKRAGDRGEFIERELGAALSCAKRAGFAIAPNLGKLHRWVERLEEKR